jgi:hypothetical protein
MAKKETLLENWDPKNLWTAQGINGRRDEDDPPCKIGMGKENVVRKDCTGKGVERETQ